MKGDIEFRNVWFVCDDENWVLKDVSSASAPGRPSPSSGRSGSRQTTIIALISGFEDIQKGEISSTASTSRYPKRDRRRQVAVVLRMFSSSPAPSGRTIALNDPIDETPSPKLRNPMPAP